MSVKLKPFFSYFGGKWKAAPHYPEPLYDKIIEPFAGAAGYSTRYPDRQVILYDTDPIIYGIWKFLIKVKEDDILALPVKFSHVKEVKACREAKWLIGFWLNRGASAPMKSPGTWMRSGRYPTVFWGEVIRNRIASQLKHIRHWKVYNRSYEECKNRKCTWFIDPPYRGKPGKFYQRSWINYPYLGEWCQKRKGQVIVCEVDGAKWLPFESFRTIKSTEGKRRKGFSKEVIWTNHF